VDERHNGERAEGGKEKSHAEIHCRFNHAKTFGLTPSKPNRSGRAASLPYFELRAFIR
jgi:hypothetical protein